MKRRGNILLKLPAILYGFGSWVRNAAFELNILPSVKPNIPTICVGNLSAGGTGKTPHIELLIRLLTPKYRVAVLTRGYGRVGKKPIIATEEDTARTIGDEPFQIKRKFPDVMVYVDANRRRALEIMDAMPAKIRPDVVLMDDGFQHRYVTPTFNILLTPFHLPYTQDDFLPYGNLRESKAGAMRADSIIVTNTPPDTKPIGIRNITMDLSTLDYQEIYFSRVLYEQVSPLFPDTAGSPPTEDTPVIAMAGIANPGSFFGEVERNFTEVLDELTYPDHYPYTAQDIEELTDLLTEESNSILITTEKDAMRLLGYENTIADELKHRIWYLPIQVYLSPKNTQRLIRRAERAIRDNTLHY